MAFINSSDQISLNKLSAASSDNQLKSKETGFKSLFIEISKKLDNISIQLSDQSTTSITFDGKTYQDKNSTQVQFLLQTYMSKLENIKTFAQDMLSKKFSLDDSASKMIS